MRVSLPALWLSVVACGPAVEIDGELVEADQTPASTNESNGKPIEMEERKPTCISPDLPSLRSNLFVPTCGPCHSGTAPAEGLDLTLDETALLARLMEPAAQSPSGIPLVMPGSTGSSYLYLKIAVRTPLIGDRMPKDGEPLEECTVEAVRQWILEM